VPQASASKPMAARKRYLPGDRPLVLPRIDRGFPCSAESSARRPPSNLAGQTRCCRSLPRLVSVAGHTIVSLLPGIIADRDGRPFASRGRRLSQFRSCGPSVVLPRWSAPKRTPELRQINAADENSRDKTAWSPGHPDIHQMRSDYGQRDESHAPRPLEMTDILAWSGLVEPDGAAQNGTQAGPVPLCRA
jgi:hypothetical protein